MNEFDETMKEIKDNLIARIKRQDEEIEDLKEQLHSIIKEAREYIANQRLHKFEDTTGGLTYEERKLLQILEGDSNVS